MSDDLIRAARKCADGFDARGYVDVATLLRRLADALEAARVAHDRDIERRIRFAKEAEAAEAQAERLAGQCEDALDQLEALAKHANTNPWCKSLREALAAYREWRDGQG